MLYENFCGCSLNLITAGIVIGVLDIVGLLYDIVLEIGFFSDCELIS